MDGGEEMQITDEQKAAALRLILRFLDPEDLGHAVTGEIRDEVRKIIGLDPVESGKGE